MYKLISSFVLVLAGTYLRSKIQHLVRTKLKIASGDDSYCFDTYVCGRHLSCDALDQDPVYLPRVPVITVVTVVVYLLPGG